jgi:hypothetical protein
MALKTVISLACISACFVSAAYAGPDSLVTADEMSGHEYTKANSSDVVAPETTPIPKKLTLLPATPQESGPGINGRRDNKEAIKDVITSESPPDPPKKAAISPLMVIPWEHSKNKSYLIPALEVPGFLVLLNIYSRIASPNQMEDGIKVYSSTLSSTWDHVRKQNWVFDKDPFNVNQFAHPYQGATMYGLARSANLGFWESAAYSNLGSFLWKMAGETDPPSINDQFTTGTAGSLLGEALFRMSQLVLSDGGSKPDVWHEAGAAVISPPTAFNRTAFGNRFKSIYPSLNPATFWRVQLGTSTINNSQYDSTMDFRMSYGLPGKAGYTYTRPLDYFDFEVSSRGKPNNPIDVVLLRGLLYGREYHAGNDYRGIWGLYGSYDYLSPTAFRVSTTALSLGTTGQYWVAHGVALQGSLLGGVGFGAAGTTTEVTGERDYHYGVAPQGLLALRLLLGNRAALDLDGRAYYVSGTGHYTSAGSSAYDIKGGSETIVRLKTGFNVRVYGRHGLGLQFVESIRNSKYGTQASKYQTDGTASLVYTFTGDSYFGAVEWRDNLNQ